MIKIPDEHVLNKLDDDFLAKFSEVLANCLTDPTTPKIVAYHGIVVNSNNNTHECSDTTEFVTDYKGGNV